MKKSHNVRMSDMKRALGTGVSQGSSPSKANVATSSFKSEGASPTAAKRSKTTNVKKEERD
jgi:hypothetical protein